ncbi:TetR/AcrR family transcriptional regulator [Curtobacterium sp. VKM Ac-1393]|uniref:TetR/AcrR family transcriptional regulator n=1 Tax=Curtobacterium sp. VKM Ac-1393 TaxID=2783814 RepID=UPI00188A3473|nr:TetR/AcrR family transcriptional regulator [Curtobacterium sp. VKM Ac-1393]MBF4607417.1 TetR/AcrR family transcriptional regulator [Curtobacterium sp. VKM Ac-1393]
MEPQHDERVEDDESLAERIVRGAIRAYRLHPFDVVDASVIAEVAGLSLETVQRLFPAWEALLLVTYDRWTQLRGTRRKAPPACTIDHVRLTLAEDVADPGLVRVLAGVITIASSESGFAELFRKRFDEYVEQLANGLQRDFDSGVEESGIPAYQAATQLLAVYEGLQIQMLVRPHIDVLVEFDRSVRTLRQGWKQHELPSWDLDAAVPEREAPRPQQRTQPQQPQQQPQQNHM